MAKPNRRNKALISRDGRCRLCYQKVFRLGGNGSPIKPTTDHVVERRNGGWDDWDNYQLAHAWCNSVRKNYPDPTKHPKYEEVIKARLKARKLWDEKAWRARIETSQPAELLEA